VKESSQKVFVVRGLKANLLRLPAIKSLQVLKHVDIVPSTELSIQQRFPKVFCGIGTLGDLYVIKVKADAKPYALYTPRNIPIPLRDKVREELVHIEAMEVFSKVSVVWRYGGCTKEYCLKQFNANVLWEAHPIPKR